ncbi:MAG: DUF177 domain-containing protein [Thermodesulfovibrio sp.]|jgi:uncharacterized protein|uniref:YceD family protein n=1 Tax=Thermodesulfovibrio sp. N1 TaxID=1871110 RepID=UPI00083A7C0D|nr:DUF177 domain-containing protein [Thermodesulfovibrio sp. N1]MDI6713446.1 DUF177 domain-containing protein [Thermodesulfovibrio sp.]ODA44485.1 Uncharacterized protein THER_0793 [Thermodesulfovibrio sp. N1]
MKIEVFDIPEEGLALAVEETPKIEGVKIIQPFKAILRVDKRGVEVFIKGVVSGEVELQCGRCLKEYILPIKTLLEVTYHPVQHLNKEELIELKRDEMDVDFYREGLIDTEDIIRDQILLNIPMKPLCSEDCKGLCTICGTDLNYSECGCIVQEIDPRMAILQSLLRRMKANG